MSKKREYDEEYKVQAVKFAKNLGSAKAAAEELQIPVNTLYGWIQKVKTAELDIGCGERSPEEALSIAKENQQLKKQIKALEKENRRLIEMNEFLEDAAAFFAASRQKSGKSSDWTILHIEPMTAKMSEKSAFTASSCCKAAKILRSGCRRTLRFIILVGNVSSVIDNFILP